MKKLFISVNEIVHMRPGREERGNAIVYSGDPAFEQLESFCADRPQAGFLSDLSLVDEVYFYAATSALQFCKRAMLKFLEHEKKVIMVACDCYQDEKDKFAEKNGIKQVWSECGGQQTMSDQISLHAK